LWAACALAASLGLQAGPVLAVESRGAKAVTIAAPVRLPAVHATEQAVPIASQSQPLMPFRFTPITGEAFQAFEPLPAVDFDLGVPRTASPTTASPTIGGWISVGYGRGGVGQ
jgi:hypothetical protein